MRNESSIPIESVSSLKEFEANEYVVKCVAIAMVVIAVFVQGIGKKRCVAMLPTTGIFVLFGFVVGVLVQSTNHTNTFHRLFLFDSSLFFSVLLPPILFHTGVQTNLDKFEGHLTTVGVLVLFGTLVSWILTATMIYQLSPFFGAFELTYLECLLFSSVVASTDPVSVVPLLSATNVPHSLYAMVVGESALNDGVSLVLYRVVSSWIERDLDLQSNLMLSAILDFGVSFGTSFLIGISFGLLCVLLSAVIERTNSSNTSEIVAIQSGLLCLVPYLCYTVCEASRTSGIVGILFCGGVVSKYALWELDGVTRTSFEHMTHTISHLAETAVFLIFGLALSYTRRIEFKAMSFAILSLLCVLLARGVHVVLTCVVVNLFRAPPDRYGGKVVFFTWLSGLRGTISFALICTVHHTITNDQVVRVMHVGVLVVTLVTMIVGGGLLPLAMKWFPFKPGDGLPHSI